MNIYREQSKNVFKTWLLMTLFIVVIVGIGWVFSEVYNDPTILYVAIIFSLVMNIFSYWFSDRVILSMYRARHVTDDSHPELYNIVENLAITAGMPMPKVYVIPDGAPNAFATGRNKEHAAIVVTEGLLRILNRSELEGVLAHELSHIGNKDILISTIVIVLVGFVSLISHFFLRSVWWGGLRNRDNERGSSAGIFMIIGVVLAILSPLAVSIIQLAISRKREYLADASGALLTRYPEGLASALEKISRNAQPVRNATEVTAHLFIANPFGGMGRKVATLFSTHPPIEDRIRILRGMEEEGRS